MGRSGVELSHLFPHSQLFSDLVLVLNHVEEVPIESVEILAKSLNTCDCKTKTLASEYPSGDLGSELILPQ